MTKEQLKRLFGITFFDHEVELFNAMLEAHREGKKIVLYPARQSSRTHKVSRCFDIYRALQGGIKVDQVYFDEFIGGQDDSRSFDD